MLRLIAIALLGLCSYARADFVTPLGAGGKFTCQTSAPAPSGSNRMWIRCSDKAAIFTDSTNTDRIFGISASAGATKGDLLVGNGTDFTRLAVGANGLCLKALSTETTGLVYGSCGGGGGGGMAIGDPVTGGTNPRILYIDGSGNLAQSAGLRLTNATPGAEQLNVGFRVMAETHAFLTEQASSTGTGSLWMITGGELRYTNLAGTVREFVATDQTQTLTNKTLTAPVLGGSITGTYTLAGAPTLGASLTFGTDNTQTIGSGATNRAATVYGIQFLSGASTNLVGANVADGSSAIAVRFNNATNLADAGAKLASFQNNAVEKAAVMGTGDIVAPKIGATAATLHALPSGTGAVAVLDIAQTFTKAQGTAAVALSDGANIATDASTSNTFTVTLGGNRTLDNPTNLVAGFTYVWIITQDGTGTRTLAYGSNFKWPGGSTPVLTTAASSVDMISCVYTGSTLKCAFLPDIK